MTLDTTLSPTIRNYLLVFIITSFQSLDSGIVRKECAPLVSISIWHNISTDKKRERKLDQSVQLRKAWRAAAKRYEASDDDTKPRLRFERSWLFTLTLDFLGQLYNEKSKAGEIPIPYVPDVTKRLTRQQRMSDIASASLSSCRICRANCLPEDMSILLSRTSTYFLSSDFLQSSMMRTIAL